MANRGNRPSSNVVDLAAFRVKRLRGTTKMPVVPGHEQLYEVTSRILLDHPSLTPAELAEYLDEL